MNLDLAHEQRVELRLAGLSRRQFLKMSPGTLDATALADRAHALTLLWRTDPDLNYDLIRERVAEHDVRCGTTGDRAAQRAEEQARR